MNKFTKLRQLVRLTVTWQDSYLHLAHTEPHVAREKKTLIPLLSQVSAYIISRCTAEVNLDSIDEIMCSYDTAYNNHLNLLTTCIKVAYKKLQMAYIISSKRSRGIKGWTPTQRILLSMRNLLLPLLLLLHIQYYKATGNSRLESEQIFLFWWKIPENFRYQQDSVITRFLKQCCDPCGPCWGLLGGSNCTVQPLWLFTLITKPASGGSVHRCCPSVRLFVCLSSGA